MSLTKLYASVHTGQADDRLVKIVVLSQRLIWLWMPKNAGGSISRALMKAHGESAIPCDLTLESLWRLNPDLKSFRIMAVKRNPYTRAVSCWLNKVMFPAASNESYFRRYAGLRQGMSFPDFAEWLDSPEGSDEHANPHWESQHRQLARATDMISFEDLPNSVRVLGLDPASLPHRNRNADMADEAGIEQRPLLDWYDARAFRHISERYAKDLEVLGYAFPADPPKETAPAEASAS